MNKYQIAISNEQISISKEQVVKGKIRRPHYLLIATCYLLFCISCSSPFDFTEGAVPAAAPEAVPAGMGYFRLDVGGVTGARTILPSTKQEDFASYTFFFYPVNSPGNDEFSVDRTNANLGGAVLLNAGTWELVVIAYMDAGRTLPAAEGSTGEFVIGEGGTTTGSATLAAVDDDGMGTFKYTLLYSGANSVAHALIYIERISGGEVVDTNITTDTPGEYIDSKTLEAGFYRVIFSLIDSEGRTAVRREILHIYRNMESVYKHPFTDANFFAALTGDVTISGNHSAGETLTAEADLGVTTGAVYYQWKRDGVNIEGETTSSYTLTADDVVGTVITVEVHRQYYNGSVSASVAILPGLDVTTNSDGTYTITGLPDAEGDIVIPGSINGIEVTTIASGAFKDNDKITSVDIPDSVTSIGDEAFSDCSGLTSVNIPDGVESIGVGAFSGCSNLESITIGNSVTSIGNYAFVFCTNLTSITIGNSVESIGDGLFLGCSNLTSIDIPDSVTSIGEGAFMNCSSLINVDIPDSVTSIGNMAFMNCSLTSVTIGNGVESIGNQAFQNCSSLEDITIGNSVESIGNQAFQSCSSLTSVTIPDSVTSIGWDAFRDCTKLASISIGNSVTSIGNQVFMNCSSLTSVTIPDSVTSIGNTAFSGCSGLTSVTIGNSVTSIGASAFSGCTRLENITIPESVTTIADTAFFGCSGLTSLTILGVTRIGDGAFMGCSNLISVDIPNVTHIGINAFFNCAELISVTFGDDTSISDVGDGAFPGDLRAKYLAVGTGGKGTYTRPEGSESWTKQ